MTHKIDETIKNCVVHRLIDDQRIDASDIRVAVRQGVVVLKGRAPNPLGVQYAGEIALNTPGVTQVKNELEATYAGSARAPSNIAMRSRLLSSIILHPDMDADDVRVSVVDGEVTLAGSVSSKREKERVRNIAVRQSGVVRVKDEVAVAAAEDEPIPDLGAEIGEPDYFQGLDRDRTQ